MPMVPRIITAFGVELTGADGAALPAVRPINLSENGLCVQLGIEPQPEQVLQVRITLGNQEQFIATDARVVWVRKDTMQESYYCGLGFVSLQEQHRQTVRQYVQQGAAWLLEFLSEFPLFAAFSAEDCSELLPIITLRDLKPREILYRAGEQDTDMGGLFIVYAGLLNIYKGKVPLPDHQLTIVSPGQIFGEITLVTEAPHSATVMAVNATKLIQISKAGFMALRKKQPALCLKVMEVVARALAARLGRATAKMFSPIKM